ncbi:MAG: hypothetical protein EOO15_16210 [Chitinophagaceae bacterium]|nr:MAG: hypothetical protein EOO15_16210 [Chitinophagaceae bacterium]
MSSLQQPIAPAAPRSFGTVGSHTPVAATGAAERDQRTDPSSRRPSCSYPIPSFFDYRVRSNSRDGL